ncbi:MAG TPA: hypothetical protein VGW75_15515 [Solirubrobacteraceae bacterium]|nr:hypothetical protein [Solirubrobacteraceae bacterium]
MTLEEAERLLDGGLPIASGRPDQGVPRSRVPVAVARDGDDGAVLFLGPRSDGGIQFFCVRATRTAGGPFVALEQHADAWPRATLDRPVSLARHVELAAVVAETDGDSLVVVAPFVADASVERVEVAVDGGQRAPCPLSSTTGAGLALTRAPGHPRAVELRAHRADGSEVARRVPMPGG